MNILSLFEFLINQFTGATTDDHDNDDPSTAQDVDNGKDKIREGSGRAPRRTIQHSDDIHNPPDSGHLSDRLGKVIKSVLRLRNQRRGRIPGVEDEESGI